MHAQARTRLGNNTLPTDQHLDLPLDLDPFDVTALEVILRNVEVRKGYRIDVKKDPARVIDLPRVKE